jgi:hypothetical protein
MNLLCFEGATAPASAPLVPPLIPGLKPNSMQIAYKQFGSRVGTKQALVNIHQLGVSMVVHLEDCNKKSMRSFELYFHTDAARPYSVTSW